MDTEISNARASLSFTKYTIMYKAVYKFNDGNGALLCSKCRTIIRQGHELTEQDRLAIQGKVYVPDQYCDKCTDDKILSRH